MELIAINEMKVGEEQIKTVNARDLHAFLESKRQFSNWIQDRVHAFGFIEGVDFITLNNFVYFDSKARIEYHLSINMAKEISMVERNEKGKQARQYFIACEKKALETLDPVKVRELYSFLGVKKDFSNWIKRQVERARLVENRDYLLTQKGEQVPSGTKWKNEYHLSLDAGKHIAMFFVI